MLGGVASIIVGWLGLGFGFTTTLGHPISTILFLGGLALFIAGIVLFIVGANTKSYEK